MPKRKACSAALAPLSHTFKAVKPSTRAMRKYAQRDYIGDASGTGAIVPGVQTTWLLTSAIQHLSSSACGLKPLVVAHGEPSFYSTESNSSSPSNFQSLAKAIVYQQVREVMPDLSVLTTTSCIDGTQACSLCARTCALSLFHIPAHPRAYLFSHTKLAYARTGLRFAHPVPMMAARRCCRCNHLGPRIISSCWAPGAAGQHALRRK